jgi:hypothetical protein
MGISALRTAHERQKIMRHMLVAGTAGLFLAFGAFGAANASDFSSTPRFATALPNFFSARSPLMANHYGYDDRDTTTQVVEGRAAAMDFGADRSAPLNP